MQSPRDDLTRGWRPGLESREEGEGRPVLFGHFTPFEQWSEINSVYEGHFMERTVKGAFSKTIQQNRDGIKVLYDHGHDPDIGNKPLGPIRELREEDFGPYYEVPLTDTAYNRDSIIPLLKDGLLSASYRFKVMREEWVDSPERSDFNPERLPERTIIEARLYEFGPVTFPAFAGATAKIRSLSDHFHHLNETSILTPRTAEASGEVGTATTTPDADSRHLGRSDQLRRQAALTLRGI
jgi:hypothetical protein